MALSIVTHADGLHRCSWCGTLPDYMHYHDTEWGFPVSDDARLFEKITLEGFQSGLSWLTILRKRAAFRAAFVNFDAEVVARFTDADVARLLQDAGIVRHRGKIESAINNARRILALKETHNSLAAFVWSYEPAARTRPKRITPELAMTMTQSPESVALSKELKKRGFSFVGPTTMYAFMQSMGVVNDHLHGCGTHAAVEAARSAFVRPV
jgi:DNA-3-methyladenine glycosylase I